jgi:putative restriction endonuclease
MPARTYGEIPSYPVGSTFQNRAELAASGVHRPTQGGICGGVDGAESIVVSGGYVDDVDHGEELIYTGQGGNDPATRRQVADQELTRGNAGLARNQLDGTPVRVVRGAGGEPTYSPPAGLRYDGLFRVADHWHEIGKDGYRIWRFRLVTLESSDAPVAPPVGAQPAGRVEATIQRLVRSTRVAMGVKKLHDYTCQVCGLRLATPIGPYAEAAHIRALGNPHNGPDVASNVLCLCPNHHVLFDAGAIYVDATGIVRDSGTDHEIAKLRRAAGHGPDPDQLAYHRGHHVP